MTRMDRTEITRALVKLCAGLNLAGEATNIVSRMGAKTRREYFDNDDISSLIFGLHICE